MEERAAAEVDRMQKPPLMRAAKTHKAPFPWAMAFQLALAAAMMTACADAAEGDPFEQGGPGSSVNGGFDNGEASSGGAGAGTTGLGGNTGLGNGGFDNQAGSSGVPPGTAGSTGTGAQVGATGVGANATGSTNTGGQVATTTGGFVDSSTSGASGTTGIASSGDSGGLSSAGTSGGGLGGLSGLADLFGGGATGPVTPLDPSVRQPDPSKLPQVNGACPDFRDGATVTVNGIRFKLWVGTSAKKGPLVFYWHGTGGAPNEVVALFGLAPGGLGNPIINEIKAEGGIVASADNTSGQGIWTDYGVWATDDFKAADQIVACAIQQDLIDPGRIHELGFSAGGLAASTMYWLRSNYLASAVSYSGGTSPWPGTSLDQDPSNKAPIMLFHGGPNDWVVLSFQDQSIDLAKRAKAAGKTAYLCNHGGGHSIPAAGQRASWEFFKAHPYNAPDPWAAGTPASIPNYCQRQ